jgi:23S rRNA (cytosine1962-C5)-methyltransferase
MISRRLKPKRYQLTKDSARVVTSGHPWIFRSHLSSAADIFKEGDWLSLVGSKNEILGHGVFDKEGLIAIRVLKRGPNAPDLKYFHEKIDAALKKRENLRNYTESFRAIHGENDGLPGIVVDIYKNTAVLQTYSKGMDTLGRYLAGRVQKQLDAQNLLWKMPSKRKGSKGGEAPRLLGGSMPKKITFREGKMQLTVEVGLGQKSGMFLDLRGLRKWLTTAPLTGKRVLNLFSYTGTLGLAAEVGGAKEITNVDISEGALKAAKEFHAIKKEKHRWITADVFDWLKELSPKEKFDLIIVDPPMMAAEMSQVPQALRAYRNLYRKALDHLAPKGQIVACCCTSRISRADFLKEVQNTLGPKGLTKRKEIPPEDDHPVGFPEGDYLKIYIFG